MSQPKIDLSSQVKGMLPVSMGGTGTTSGAVAGGLPDPTGHAGEFLSTDGATFSWKPVVVVGGSNLDGGVF
jgi:hypothetical protein